MTTIFATAYKNMQSTYQNMEEKTRREKKRTYPRSFFVTENNIPTTQKKKVPHGI
jgi:hypothetical protein